MPMDDAGGPDAEGLEARTRGQWWVTDEKLVPVKLDAVRAISIAAHRRAGASEEDAAFLTDLRLDKSLQGDYVRGIRADTWLDLKTRADAGELDLAPRFTILKETASSALIDGTPKVPQGLLGRFAMSTAMNKARAQGVGYVALRSNIGLLTAHVREAAEAGMVAMVFTQSFPTVAPFGGVQALLGNAPVAFGIPAGDRDPVVIDMSLTNSSSSPVVDAARRRRRLPDGFIYDRNGQPSDDANDYRDLAAAPPGVSLPPQGSLVPLGGSHKSYALIFMIGLLTAALTGTDFPWESPDMSRGGTPADPDGRYGSMFIVIDPAAFVPMEAFRARVDAFIDHLKASPKRAGVDEILYPGEQSQRLKRQRREGGKLLIPASQFEAVMAVARALDLHELAGAVAA